MAEERRLDVLEHGEPAEDAGDLEGAADPAAAQDVGRQATDLLAAEVDLAGVVRDVAGDEVEERRLPRPVGPDDGSQVSRGHDEIHAVDGLDATEVLAQPDGAEGYFSAAGRVRHVLASTSPTNPRGRTTMTTMTMEPRNSGQ
jgi:hypothetical protein